MPRPSQYDYYGNPTADATRLQPPEGLPDDVAAIFLAITSVAAADHFAPAERPLLVEYCRSLARCSRAEEAIHEEGEIVGGKANPWLLILRDARHQVGTLATKLRLAPNARTEAKQVKGGVAGLDAAYQFTQRSRND